MKIFRGKSKEKGASQSDSKSEHTLTGPLWARFRQLEARVSNTESRVTALRRDVDRIDKKQCRDINKLASEEVRGNGGHEGQGVAMLPDPFRRL